MIEQAKTAVAEDGGFYNGLLRYRTDALAAMSVGGRAGHSGLWTLDVDEGEYQPGVQQRWEVAVRPATEARQAVHHEREAARSSSREQAVAAKREETKQRIIRAAAKYQQGETATVIRDTAGLHDREFKPALREIVEAGGLLPCQITKPCRKTPFPGYVLSSYANPIQRWLCGQNGQATADNLHHLMTTTSRLPDKSMLKSLLVQMAPGQRIALVRNAPHRCLLSRGFPKIAPGVRSTNDGPWVVR